MLKNNEKNEVPTYCSLTRSLILTQGRGKDRQNDHWRPLSNTNEKRSRKRCRGSVHCVDLCSLEKSEKSVVDQISQCSSVVKNPKNSYDIFINAYSCCNSHVDITRRLTCSATGWQKKINNSARIICLFASDSSYCETWQL